MRLVVPILLNCALVLAVYLVDKHTHAKKIPYIAKQIIVGLSFPGMAQSLGLDETKTL